MQIVIDISKDTFEKIREFDGEHDVLINRGNLYEAIKNGVVLPEGHGRLIDADYLKDVILLHNFHGNNKNIVPYADRRGYRLRQREIDEAIINAPTIIEAGRNE